MVAIQHAVNNQHAVHVPLEHINLVVVISLARPVPVAPPRAARAAPLVFVPLVILSADRLAHCVQWENTKGPPAMMLARPVRLRPPQRTQEVMLIRPALSAIWGTRGPTAPAHRVEWGHTKQVLVVLLAPHVQLAAPRRVRVAHPSPLACAPLVLLVLAASLVHRVQREPTKRHQAMLFALLVRVEPPRCRAVLSVGVYLGLQG